MGMYTVIRGFLQVDLNEYEELIKKVDIIKKDYISKYDDENYLSSLVTFSQGSNGSLWLFIGSDAKDYGDNRERFLKFLIDRIPCKGRIEFQYEEYDINDIERLWLIHNGIIEESSYEIHYYI